MLKLKIKLFKYYKTYKLYIKLGMPSSKIFKASEKYIIQAGDTIKDIF